MKIAVVGLGVEGKNAVKSLINYGHKVYASDIEKDIELEQDNTVDFDLGYHDFDKINSADAVVLSPSLYGSKIGEKIRSSKKFLSDVLRDHKSIFTIGVTGTNGKTTTCFMIKEILEKAGLNVLVGGNAGGGFEGYTKLILETSKKKYDVLIVEVCDMTLDFCSYVFDFDLMVVTNIGHDHLEVHNTLVNYKKSLCRFLEGKKVILNEKDELSAQIGDHADEKYFFGEELMDLKIFGRFNIQNASAAGKVAKILKISDDIIKEALDDFKGVKGRSTRINLFGSNIIIGKTDNADAAAAVFNESQFEVVIIGTPRENETWRYDIFKEVSKANPEIVVLFPGIEDTTHKAYKKLKKEGYDGHIRVLKDVDEVVEFVIQTAGSTKNIFIGGNGQKRIIEIQEILDKTSKDNNLIMNKKVLVIGAGNAGRPVAHLLKHLGNEVIISDIKNYRELPKKARGQIKHLKKKGIATEFGCHVIDNIKWADVVFISPNVPQNADIRHHVFKCKKERKLVEITAKEIGQMLNSLMKIPMIGIAGTDGKTTTTNLIDHSLNDRYDTLLFSSLQNSLVIEGLVDYVVENGTDSKDFAVFELPHGTIRMVDGLELCLGVLTNLTPDHMDEFSSFYDYVQRNLSIKDLLHTSGVLVVNGDDPIISKKVGDFKQKTILYGFKEPRTTTYEGKTFYTNDNLKLDVIAEDVDLMGLEGSEFTLRTGRIPTVVCENCGKICCDCDSFQRRYMDALSTRIRLKIPGMCNIENAMATFAVDLALGFDLESIKDKIENFNGINGRFEKISTIEGVNLYMDAAHNPEGMERLLDGLILEGRLLITLDNPDTLTVRDKVRIGSVLGRYADVIVASAKNETTEEVDLNASKMIMDGAGDIEKYQTIKVSDAILKALEIANEKDTIIHMGPGVVNAHDNVISEINIGIKLYEDSKI